MSEQNSTETPETQAIAETVKADVREMSPEEFQIIEHEIQSGIRETMPDGTRVSDVFKNLVEQQKAQAERMKTFIPEQKKVEAVKIEVTTFSNGAMAATAIGEKVEVVKTTTNSDDTGDGNSQPKEPDNDLSPEFPFRDKLIAAGYVSLEQIGKFTIEDLKLIDGIGPKSAEAIFNYGKSA